MNITADEFNKIALAVVAIVTVIVAPIVQWQIFRRQAALQVSIAKSQTELQASIAQRAIADSIGTRRQAWIDELRTEMAEYLTIIGEQVRLINERDWITHPEKLDSNYSEERKNYVRSHELSVSILLRLNPTDSDHKLLRARIGDLVNIFKERDVALPPNARFAESHQKYSQTRDALLDQLHIVLEHEWAKIKSGRF